MSLFSRRGRRRATLWTTAPEQPGAVAIEITLDELHTIEKLLEQAWSYLESSPGAIRRDQPNPLPAMMRAWNQRVGATIAVAQIEGRRPTDRMAFMESEIKTVENVVRILDERTPGCSAADRANREFLAALHRRLGHAQVNVAYYAGHAVACGQLNP
jgi:hypothetical protein